MSTGFFNTSAPREKEPSRPRHINPRTGVEQSWQRASNFAAPLDNPFGLKRHHGRQIVRGFNVRADLARMALTGAIVGEKVDEVIATALTAAEDEAKANNGSAVHAALELCDTGKEVPEEYWPHAHGYVAELKRWGLRPVAVEQTLLNTRLGAKGKTDRVYVTDSGRYLIGDIKTGSVRHPHTMAVQCEVYAGSDFVIHPDGTIEPIPWKLDQDAALIVHVDPDTGATAVYEVPLRVARWGSALAEQVRAFQRTDILMPYSGAPTGPLADQLRREAVASIASAVDVPAAILATPPNAEQVQDAAQDFLCRFEGKLASEHPIDVPGQFHCITPEPRPATTPEPAVVAGVDLTQHQAAAAGPLKSIIVMGSDEYQARMAELLKPKNDKATLQRMYADLGGTDLAHHRKWLAEHIIAAENSIASTQQHASGAGAQQVQPATAVAQTIEQGVPRAEATPFMLKQIAEAATVGDIQRIHANVVAQSGEAAWTDAMTEVARVRVAELDGGDEASTMAEIEHAQTTQDLARVWERVTSNGNTMSAWSAQYDTAAKKRGAEITAAQPPTPVSPWGTS